MRKLCIDTANLLFRVAAANSRYGNGTAEEKAGLAMHISLQTMNKFYKIFQPHEIAITFEGPRNWRKDFVSKFNRPKYKANRIKDPSMIPFFELIASFEEMVRNYTSIICLQNTICEGDDMVAAYCQVNDSDDDQIIIVSGDGDFEQLLKYKNVDIIKPDATKTVRKIYADKKETFDPEYFLFAKCFRGDKKDNVFASYPNLRETKILKAYEDDYARTTLMNTELEALDKDLVPYKYRVGDVWEENKILLDLECQPEHVKEAMFETVVSETENCGKFNQFHFQKFLGKYNLDKISENIDVFEELFSSTYRNSKNKKAQILQTDTEVVKRKSPKDLLVF